MGFADFTKIQHVLLVQSPAHNAVASTVLPILLALSTHKITPTRHPPRKKRCTSGTSTMFFSKSITSYTQASTFPATIVRTLPLRTFFKTLSLAGTFLSFHVFLIGGEYSLGAVVCSSHRWLGHHVDCQCGMQIRYLGRHRRS